MISRIAVLATSLISAVFCTGLHAAAPAPGVPMPPGVAEALNRLNQEYANSRLAEHFQKVKADHERPSGIHKNFTPGNTVNLPVLLGKFSDLAERFDEQSFQTLLFGANPTGSMTDYYKEVSRNNLTVNGTASGWFTMPENQAYYVSDGNKGLSGSGARFARDLIAAADATVDYSQFDSDNDGYVDVAMIIHTGGDAAAGAANSIWSHSSSLNNGYALAPGIVGGGEYITNDPWPGHPGEFIKVDQYIIQPELRGVGAAADPQISIGVFCHEFGHSIGLPDLYDLKPDGAVDSNGVGQWCLMGSGNYGGDGQHPERPVHPSAWCKLKMGWAAPTVVNQSTTALQISQAETDGPIYKFVNPVNPAEYFLVENRQQTGFDTGLLIGGLAVWHVDEDIQDNNNVTQKHVDLEEADGLAQLDNLVNRGDPGDLFPGASGKRAFDEQTNPDSKSYYDASMFFILTDISDSKVTMSASVLLAPQLKVSASAFAEVTSRTTLAITATNVFSSGVNNATIRCAIPDGAAFVSADSGGTLENNEVQWTVNIPALNNATVKFDITPNRAGTLTIGPCSISTSGRQTVAEPVDLLVTGTALIRDIGALYGTYSAGVSINNSGQVAANTSGRYTQPDGITTQYAWPGRFDGYGRGESIRALIGDFAKGYAGRYSYAADINDGGQVVGRSEMFYHHDDDPTYNPDVDPFYSNPYRAFIWSGGEPSQLQSLYAPNDKGWSTCVATGINNSGQVTGYSNGPGLGTWHAVRWNAGGGAPTDLGTLGGDRSEGRAINNAGQVAGFSYTIPGDFNSRATLWNGNSPQDLGVLPGSGIFSEAHGINNLGHVVGDSEIAHLVFRPFVWTPEEGMVNLGANVNVRYAVSINDNGLIVGESILWHNRHPISLYRILPENSGWSELYALKINNQNQITGSGKHFLGQTRGYVIDLPPDAPPTIGNPRAVVRFYPLDVPVSFPGTGGMAEFSADVADDRVIVKVEAELTHPDNSIEKLDMPTFTATANKDTPKAYYTVPENNSGVEQIYSVRYSVMDSGHTKVYSNSVSFAVRAKIHFTIAPAISPDPGVEGQTTTFSCSTNEPEATIIWEFPTGAKLYGSPSTKTFSTPGSYSVTVSAKTHTKGGDQLITEVLNFRIVNTPLVFTTLPDYSPAPGTMNQNVSFSCVINDPHATCVWSFSDGGANLTGRFVTRKFATPGTYQATATATNSDQTLATVINVVITRGPLVFTSQPANSPNPGRTLQPVSFSCAVSDPGATITWTFFDGGGSLTGSSVTKTFSVPGVYQVTVNVVDEFQQTLTKTFSVTIIQPGGANSTDTDGDGFPDNVENAAGSSPANKDETPFGSKPAGAPEAIEVPKMGVKLVFNKPLADSITFNSGLPVPDGFAVAGQKAIVVVGGVVQPFTFNEKGSATNASGSAKLGVKAKKGVVSAQTAKFDVKLQKGNFAAALADAGLTNENVVKQMRELTISIYFNDTVFTVMRPVTYSAKQGKSGAAK